MAFKLLEDLVELLLRLRPKYWSQHAQSSLAVHAGVVVVRIGVEHNVVCNLQVLLQHSRLSDP